MGNSVWSGRDNHCCCSLHNGAGSECSLMSECSLINGSSNRNIRDSMKWNTGLEDLKSLTYEEHVKCPSCMIGKAILEDFPKARQVKVKPQHQINVDSFSFSVASIAGHNHAVVFVDKCSGYNWACSTVVSAPLWYPRSWVRTRPFPQSMLHVSSWLLNEAKCFNHAAVFVGKSTG
jgi:hypothetical protein